MSTPAAVPIAIQASPPRSMRQGSRKATTEASHHHHHHQKPDFPPAASSTLASSAGSPKQTRQTGGHSRRASRIDMLTELLLPDVAFDISVEPERRRSAGHDGIMPVDAKRAEALRTRLSSITARSFLENCPAAAREPYLLALDTDIDIACQHLAKCPDRGSILLRRSEGSIIGTSVPHAVESSSRNSDSQSSPYSGVLSLEDIHSFLCLLFCPHSKSSGDRASAYTSPPSSPGIGKARPLYPSATPPCEQLAMIAARTKAKKTVSAGLVANLSGLNRLRVVSPDSTLDEIISHLTEPGVGYVAVVHSDGRDEPSQAQADAPLGLISSTDVLDFLAREANRDETIAAVLSERLDELSSLSFTSAARPISSDKSVLDAMTLMNAEALQSVATLDARGVLLSPLSSAELAYEVIRAESRKILNTPLAALVKTMRSRRPEGTDGKDTHPAVSVSLSSLLSRAVSLMLTTSAQGIFVLDDLVPAMTPPLPAISPSSPTRELDPWTFHIDATVKGNAKAGSIHDGDSNGSQSGAAAAGSSVAAGAKASNHRRSSSTTPRYRGPSSASGAVGGGTSLSKAFVAPEGGESATAAARASQQQSKSPSSSALALASSFSSSTSPPISAAVGGPGFVRCHRPRSMSLVGVINSDATSWRREGVPRQSGAGTTGLALHESAASLSRSSSLSVSTSSSSSSSIRGGGEGSWGQQSASTATSGSTLGGSGAGAGASQSQSPSHHVAMTGWATAYTEGTSLAPVRFHLSADAMLCFLAHCAALQASSSC